MTKIQLYIATTIDGFIAREDGSLDWLDELPNPDNIDYGYADFIKEVDTVVMGRKTYEDILGFGVEWPYSQCKSYVVSSNNNYEVQTDNTEVLNSIDESSINKLKAGCSKNIWVVGGGEIITQFLNHDAVDDMILCIIPRILGNGIRLFPNGPKETKFVLVKSEQFETGAVMLTYRKEN